MMKLLRGNVSVVMVSAVMAATMSGRAVQAQAAGASVHGHITTVVGQPLTSGDVKFTKDKTESFDKQRMLYTFPVDKDGNYKATGVGAGDYYVYVTQGEKHIDQMELSVKNGDDKTLDFDMTRAEYVKLMTPEEKKALEEYKKKNAEVVSANKVIAGLNATLKTVRADLEAAAPTKADVSKDVDSMKQAVDAKADAAILWLTYGDTLQAQGDHMKAEDKKAGKNATTDEDLAKEYSDSVDAYKKGIALDAAGAKPNLKEEAVTLNQMGNVLGKAGKGSDAVEAFDGAAKADPTAAGKYYKNEAAILFNNNETELALAAAEKAIAADPNAADPYFIKGQALVGKSAFDPKTNKLTPPPGCIEAYQKFLELAPNDPYAAQVKEVLGQMGQKIDKNYRAPK
jgi:tetratricopeptide (TPR) repeat protein